MAERFTKLLVLDLDETLVHALGRGEPDLPWPPQRRVAHFRVYLRPGVHEFMAFALERFVAVGIWTSASTEYAMAMAERIVDRKQLRFLHTREHCIQGSGSEPGDSGYWIKDLTSLDGFGFDDTQILIVDDKARGLERNLANLIHIRPFLGDPSDRELDKLELYLTEIGGCEDARAVDKRGWWMRYDS